MQRARAAAALLGVAVTVSGCGVLDGLVHPGPGVWGTVVSVDDTGLPDTPAGGGRLAVLPARRLDDLLARAGGFPADQIAYVGLSLDQGTVEGWGGVMVEVDDDGDFLVPVQGRVVVCRLPSEHTDHVRGCARLALPERGRARATVGEAGFHLWME